MFRAAGLDFLEIETGDFRLTVRRDGVPGDASGLAAAEAPSADGVAAAVDRAPLRATGPPDGGPARPDTGEPALVTAGPQRPATREIPDGSVVISAPTAGVFYRGPQPGAPPFAELGTAVAEGATVGLVEVMKLFNAVTSPVDGVVENVCAADEEVVEAGQPLVIIRPAA